VGLLRAELFRKAVHIGAGVFALPLRVFTWPEAALMAVAAFAFNWRVLPHVGGRALWRRGEHGRSYDLGILLYPAAVLALVLAFHDRLWAAAAAWGVMAWGDGMATIVGQGAGGPRLPWNAAKTWSGLAAFVLFGSAAAAALTVWTARLPASALVSPWIMGASVAVAVACAAAESLPTGIDDNLTVPVAAALAIALLEGMKDGTLGEAIPPLGLAAATASAIALAGWAAGALDTAGAVSTALVGTAITAALGWPALGAMGVFFVLGSAATRLGYRRKAERGIAQGGGGARGWRSVWANGAVPAVLALAAAAWPPSAGLLALAYAGAVAAAAADTCSSEIGKAYGRRTVGITTLRPAPPGVEGGISLEGTAAGLGGAVAVAAAAVALGLCSLGGAVAVAAAGFVAGLAESAIGGWARGRYGLGDHALNVLDTALGAAGAVALARVFG
jgi:uncharacterized protein (TIGR00297 family)